MKTTIRILTIVAVAIMLLTLVLQIGVVALQNLLIPAFFDERARYFVVPAQTLIRSLLMVVATGALCVFINNKKGSILFEIIFLGFLVLMCLVPTSLISSLEDWITYELIGGSRAQMQLYYVKVMLSVVDFLYPIGYALALLSCGMSIGRQKTLKSIEQ